MKLIDIIKSNRPNLSENSIKAYSNYINTIAKELKTNFDTIDDVIKNEKQILDLLLSKNLNTRKSKLSAFIVALDDKKGNKKQDEVLETFRKQITKDGEDNNKKEDKQVLNKSQSENFIPWKSVLDIYEDYKDKYSPLLNKERLTLEEFTSLQKYIILSLYTMIPPRRSLDYISFKIRGDIDKEEDNFMLEKMKQKKVYFVFNKYKNSSRLGQQLVQIPDDLKTLIKKWTKKNPYDYLLVDNKGNPLKQYKLTEILNQIFDKKISSSMLRHIFLTKKYGDIDLEDIKKTTQDMGSSSINRTLKYVSKDNVDSK